MNDYGAFLAGKMHDGEALGFEPLWLPDFLFDFQRALVEWSLRKGRAAIFADCGLGKTPMQLVWAENVVRHANRPVLIVTPLAVGAQTIREAAKFGIEAARSGDGTVKAGARVVITNYERLEKFSPSDFAGVVCDESSAIKAFDGVRRAVVTEFLRTMRYRLLCTATASPNDYIELGTSSEALGELGHMDMLTRFFKKDDTAHPWMRGAGRRYAHGGGETWRFKHHAEQPFWRWVCSWARAVRRPSDLGFDDGRFVLPQLEERQHHVESRSRRDGMLFNLPAIGLKEQREERRLTIRERCEKVAALVSDTKRPAVVWCHLNDEGDALTEMIPDADQVSGADSDEAKEEKFLAFADGQLRVLVTKPKIGAFGLNWQHCSHMTFFPSHSYEQYYQGVRRCWRFGQTRRVVVDVIATEGERAVMDNLRRKAAAADRMFTELVSCMNDSMCVRADRSYALPVEVPPWL